MKITITTTIAVALAAGCVADVPADTQASAGAVGGACQLDNCTIEFMGGYTDDPLQQLFGCSETYFYYAEREFGAHGVAFCPDSPANRARYILHHYRFKLPGFCNDCLTVPEGKLMVEFDDYPGPGCPGGCLPDA